MPEVDDNFRFAATGDDHEIGDVTTIKELIEVSDLPIYRTAISPVIEMNFTGTITLVGGKEFNGRIRVIRHALPNASTPLIGWASLTDLGR